jgi:hypothetical protein
MASDEGDDSEYVSEADMDAARRSRRRKQAVVAVAGLAAVLGGGAFFVTEATTAKQAIAPDPAALMPTATSASATPPPVSVSPRVRPSEPARSGATVSRTPSPAVSEAADVAERIAAARAAAAKDGVPLQRPLPPAGAAPTGPVTVTNSGSLQRDGATLRIVTARYDLTGQHELALAADDGVRVGDVRCTQNFRFSNDATPHVRPTMLLCWHTSAGKSVVTLAVSRQGRPSQSASAAAIDKQWARLG